VELARLGKSKRLTGTIKQSPGDFIVEEIMPDGRVLGVGKQFGFSDEGEGEFSHFVLQKSGWNTQSALEAASHLIGAGKKRFSFAGTKDRNAETVQLASMYAVKPSQLAAIANKLENVKINGAWKAKEKVALGDLAGNRFQIRVSGISKNADATVKKIHKEIKGVFPNYFGMQRFGSRGNTHVIGRALALGNARKAVLEYLTFGGEREDAQARKARAELAATHDYKKALAEFPSSLKYERMLLAHLAQNPYDYVNALRRLPRGLALMFVHAYQSYLFNLHLSRRVETGDFKAGNGEYFCGIGALGFPGLDKKEKSGYLAMKLIGYETLPENLSRYEKNILEIEGIAPSDFRIRCFPEISAKGSYRTALCPLVDFKFKKDTFGFSLPSGAYATSALEEFVSL
jgi:tRNA pseudouridine13 synthase